MGERKFVQMVQVTRPKRLPCPYTCMIKTFKNLWDRKTDNLETLYAASGSRVLPSLFKWWPCVDHDLFYSKVKFGPFCFCMGKCLNCRFLRNYWSLWGGSQINEVYDNLWQPTVNVIHWLLSKITQIQHFQTSLPQKTPDYWSQISYGASVGCWEWKCVQMFQVRLAGKKSPSSEPRGWWPWKLGIQHQVLRYFQIYSVDDPWLTLTIFMSQICFLMLLHGWKLIQHNYRLIVMYFQACSN